MMLNVDRERILSHLALKSPGLKLRPMLSRSLSIRLKDIGNYASCVWSDSLHFFKLTLVTFHPPIFLAHLLPSPSPLKSAERPLRLCLCTGCPSEAINTTHSKLLPTTAALLRVSSNLALELHGAW